ncbi:hypothetical protein ACFWN2_14105 [Lentzea sp. NPDC058436]|uniref:hypothetical protein n=1 Tax=Lentzea sp. NPDC058436 TaxID=3346499 RepID=UPI00364D352D
MELTVFLISVASLVVVAVGAMVLSGNEDAKLRSAKEAEGALDHYARQSGWTHVPKEVAVPAGRMITLPGVGRRAAVAGTHEGRTACVAILCSYVNNPAAGAHNGVATFALVVVFDAPELPGEGPVDVDPRSFSALRPHQPPVVDVAGGLVCFTFPDVAVAGQIEHAVALAHDVVKAFVSVTNAE